MNDEEIISKVKLEVGGERYDSESPIDMPEHKGNSLSDTSIGVAGLRKIISAHNHEVKTLKDKLTEKDEELLVVSKLLEKSDRLLRKSKAYNEELRCELSKAMEEIHNFRHKKTTDAETQVGPDDIETEYGNKPMPSWTDESCVEGSIADIVKEAATAELEKQEGPKESSEYVFDESSGFYYHPQSGYYWDPNSNLFYDYISGNYFSYNAETSTYEIHSNAQDQVSWLPIVDELSTSFSSVQISPTITRKATNNINIGQYPPCIRVMVEESDVLSVGNLFIITCTGGSIGRDSSHSISIDSEGVSKIHANIRYNYDNQCYQVNDVGSQNGTLLNNTYLSKSREESEMFTVKHEDVLQIGKTRLRLHIHTGQDTCDHCEPGIVQANLKQQMTLDSGTEHVILSKRDKEQQRRKELKNIKKKFGLQNSYFENNVTESDSSYTDKAYLRRKYVGSSDGKEKSAQASSVESPISSTNVGHKLLSKMGWKEGSGLGKTSDGIVEPISAELRANQKAGLGSGSSSSVSLDNVSSLDRVRRWTQAQHRFNQLSGISESSSSQKSSTDTLSPPESDNKDKTDESTLASQTSENISQKNLAENSSITWQKGEIYNPN